MVRQTSKYAVPQMNYKEELNKYVLKDAGMTCLELFKTHNLIVDAGLYVILKTVPRVNTNLSKYIANNICDYKGDMLQIPIRCIEALHAYHVDIVMKACHAGRYINEFCEHFSLNKKNVDLMERIFFTIIESPNYTPCKLYSFIETYPKLRYNKKIINWCLANKVTLLPKICLCMEDMTHDQFCTTIKEIRLHGPIDLAYYVSVATLDPPTVLAELMYCFNLEPYTPKRYSEFRTAFETVAAGLSNESDLHEYLAFCLRIDDVDQAIKTIERFPSPYKFIENNSKLYLPYIMHTKSPHKYQIIVKFAESAAEAIETLRLHKFDTYTLYNYTFTYSASQLANNTISTILHYIMRFKTIDGLAEFFTIGKAFHGMIMPELIHMYTLDKEAASLLFGLCIQLKLPNEHKIVNDFMWAGHKHILNQWITCCDDERKFAEYVKAGRDGSALLYKTHVAWYCENKKVQINLGKKKRKLHNELLACVST